VTNQKEEVQVTLADLRVQFQYFPGVTTEH